MNSLKNIHTFLGQRRNYLFMAWYGGTCPPVAKSEMTCLVNCSDFNSVASFSKVKEKDF